MGKKNDEQMFSAGVQSVQPVIEKFTAALDVLQKNVLSLSGDTQEGIEALNSRQALMEDYIRTSGLDISTTDDIDDLEDPSKQALVAMLIELSKKEPNVSEKQQAYIAIVCKYLDVNDIPIECDLEKILDSIEESSVRRVFLQAAVEFYTLGNVAGTPDETHAFLQDFFSKRDIEKAKRNVSVLTQAMGTDVLLHRYYRPAQNNPGSSSVTSEPVGVCPPAEQAYDLQQSIANVMGWVANHGGFDAISVTETDDYYIVEYDSSPWYGTFLPIRENEMPSLIRINKRTGQVATNCKISTDKFCRRISDWYWEKRLSYVCGNNIYKNIAGNLVCLNAEHFNGWKTLADIGIDEIPQGYTGHILFKRDDKIYDFNTSLKQCKELCAVPFIADYFVTSEGIYILSGTHLGEVMFYSYEKKQIVPLFKVDSVNRICYVKDNVFFFIEEGYFYSPGRIKKVSLSASRQTEEIIYDDLPDCYGIMRDPSFVVPYKDCILYANKAGVLKKLSYDSDIVEDIASGVLCEQREETGIFRKKYKYNQIAAGFVCIGNWVYFYQDGRRDRPARVSLDAPNEIELVPAYDNLENAQVIKQPDVNS